jgi:hypothetical protein
MIMEIMSRNPYPANALSNFAPHAFMIDGVSCASMEGFLQSLKFSNPDMQRHVCTLIGRAAKNKGSKKNWQTDQRLYWMGTSYDRSSKEYRNLIHRAYRELSNNDGFRRAIIASRFATYQHSLGKRKPSETVLTRQEFIHELQESRRRILAEDA